MANQTEINVVLKDGPRHQMATPQYNRAQSHQGLVREATDKASESFDPLKVRPRPGWIWGKIIDVFLTDSTAPSVVRPDNAKASVRHWIETPDGTKYIFEYARGHLIRTEQGEWLMVREECILLEIAYSCNELMLKNRSILLKVDPLPMQSAGGLYAPEMRQVQAETGTVIGADTDLVSPFEKIAFIATAGTYVIIAGQEYRIIHQDQALGVLESNPVPIPNDRDWLGEGL